MVITAEHFEIIFSIGKRIFSLVDFCLLFVKGCLTDFFSILSTGCFILLIPRLPERILFGFKSIFSFSNGKLKRIALIDTFKTAVLAQSIVGLRKPFFGVLKFSCVGTEQDPVVLFCQLQFFP